MRMLTAGSKFFRTRVESQACVVEQCGTGREDIECYSLET